MDTSRSSLPYQIFLSFSKWFLPALLLVELVILMFKATSLPYPSGNLGSEVLLLVLYGIIEYGRIMSGERGNLTEKALFVLVSLVLSGPACTILAYWLLWQTYVLRVETVIVAVALAGQAVQSVLAVLVLMGFARAT